MPLKKSYFLIGALAAGLIVTSGIAGKMYLRYVKALSDMSQLQAENQEYSEELDALQGQVSVIQANVESLTKTKEELTQKLADVNPKAAAASENATAANQTTTETASPSSLNNVGQVRAAVQQLAAATQNMTVAYMDISQNVTDTLSYMDSIPSGNPVSKCVLTSLMGTRVDPIDGSVENHAGVDLSCSVGSAVEATASGTVIYSQYHSSYGYYIKIDHGNGYVTAYAHCSYLFAQVGDQVEKGDVIALSGATGQVTGPHLHYEVSLNGVYQDPLVYMDTENLPRQLG